MLVSYGLGIPLTITRIEVTRVVEAIDIDVAEGVIELEVAGATDLFVEEQAANVIPIGRGAALRAPGATHVRAK